MRLLKSVRSQLGNYHLKSGIYHFYRNEFKQAIDFFAKAMQNSEKLDEADLRMIRHRRHAAIAQSAQHGAITLQCIFVPSIRCWLNAAPLHRKTMRVLSTFRSAVEVHPTYLEAHTHLAFALLSCARPNEALEEFEKVRSLTLATLEEPYQEALAAAGRGDLAETAERMRDAFQRRPQSFAYHYRRGLKALQAGRYESAVEDLKQAVMFNPRFADVHNYLGVAYGELEQRPAAIAEFRQAIECNPDYLVARLNLAFSLAEGNETKEAVAELTAVLSKEPTNQAARVKLEELTQEREERTRMS